MSQFPMFGLSRILLVSINATLIQYITSDSSNCLILKLTRDMAAGTEPLGFLSFFPFHSVSDLCFDLELGILSHGKESLASWLSSGKYDSLISL